MKITQEHFDHLSVSIGATLSQRPDLVGSYEMGKFSRSSEVKDLDKRFRWDLLRMSGLGTWVCDNLYAYLNDTHIDSALRKIVPGLVRRY